MTRAAALALLLAACAPAGGKGGGIVSTNPCADAILVRLVPTARIAAISPYSQDPAATSMPLALARRLPATAGTAEEVLALRPALVLASTFTAPATRDAYAQAGLNVVYLDSPTTVTASIAQMQQVAAAVGEQGRGEALVREIDAALKSLAPPRRRPGPSIYEVGSEGPSAVSGVVATGPRPSPGRGQSQDGAKDPAALLYIAGDLANGAGTLLDELTRRAGFRNAAADYGLAHTGTLPAELLVAHPPAVVIATRETRGAALRRRLLPGTPAARLDRRLVNCGGPAIPPALARLRAIRASLP